MRKLMIGVATAALVVVPAFALMPEGHRGMKAPQTRAAVETMVKEHFAQVDANKDGAVTREETDAFRAKHRAEMRDKRFGMMDANKDGQLSRDEFNAAHMGQGHGMGRGDAHHGGRRGGGMMMGKGGMFAAADVNGDGKVTLAEATAKHLERFDRKDANKDGTVTPEEREAAWKAMKAGNQTKAN